VSHIDLFVTKGQLLTPKVRVLIDFPGPDVSDAHPVAAIPSEAF